MQRGVTFTSCFPEAHIHTTYFFFCGRALCTFLNFSASVNAKSMEWPSCADSTGALLSFPTESRLSTLNLNGHGYEQPSLNSLCSEQRLDLTDF